ncbi:MAG: hypothetical protein A2Y15_07505 [Clostridiales bacterium GWF2_36_10]|nr:MAG: hypothetical protein A2Y15_07505 [Clostridiales bacterium GWF2_36_10]
MKISNFTKKICSMLLTIVLLVSFSISISVFSVAAEAKTVTANRINKTRDGGHLVIYTPEFGATTNTNEWGYEVTIIDNKVTKVGGNNSAIPANGFVLSGHDLDEGSETEKMKSYLMNNIKVGDYVYFIETTLVITISDEPVTPSSFYSVSTTFTTINDIRSENSLIIYNTKGKRTETNEWGYEVVCEGGVIIKLGDNNNLIPNTEGSFVVSGHGTMAEWLKVNAKVGMAVTYDNSNKIINFVYDENTAAVGININIAALEDEYNTSIENYSYIDFETAKTKLDELKSSFNAADEAFKNGGKVEDFDTACSESAKKIADITLLLSESRTVEYRGVWIRPTQKTKAEVEAYVQSLYDAGINLICIETLYNSTMIMPMPEDNLFKQNPEWKGFDTLQAFIDACHARNMELHVWMPIFYVGHAGSTNASIGVAAQKPEWLSLSNTGEPYSPEDEDKFLFLSPANPDATAFLLKTYKYILENYNIDGFELDYIRYYRRTENYDFGYDEIAVNAFKDKYGVTPEYKPTASYWKDWVAFRQQYVTDMVVAVRNLINEVRPSVLLSADVGPNINESLNEIYQNYVKWLDEGYLDLLHPMSYGEGFEDEIEKQVKRCGDKTFISVGLGIFMPELTAKDMLRQAKMVNSLGGDGATYFEASAYLNKGTGEILTSSIYRNKAITPTLDKTAALIASLNYSIGRIDDVIVPLEGMSEDEANSVKTALNAIITAVNEGKAATDAFAVAETAINTLSNSNAKAILLDDLAYSEKIATAADRIPERTDVSMGESTDNSTSTDDGSSQDTITTEPKNNDWVLPVIIIVIIIIAAIGIIVFLRKKSSTL